MNRNVRNCLSVAYGYFKLSLLKVIHKVKYGKLPRVSIGTEFAIDSKARLMIGNRFLMRGGSRIRISKGAMLKIGNNVAIRPNCMLATHEYVEIGDNVQLSPNVQIYDHDHDFRHFEGLRSNHFNTTPVYIGNNVWIGANVVILRGTRIGDGCVVGAGAVIKGDYPDNCLIVQKKETSLIYLSTK